MNERKLSTVTRGRDLILHDTEAGVVEELGDVVHRLLQGGHLVKDIVGKGVGLLVVVEKCEYVEGIEAQHHANYNTDDKLSGYVFLEASARTAEATTRSDSTPYLRYLLAHLKDFCVIHLASTASDSAPFLRHLLAHFKEFCVIHLVYKQVLASSVVCSIYIGESNHSLDRES